MSARDLFLRVVSDLETGRVDLANLGEGKRQQLDLSDPGQLTRYASLLRPRIERILDRNRTLENVTVAALVVMFVFAVAMAVVGHLRGAEWLGCGVAIPGLGVAAVWPIRHLLRIRADNSRLRLLPELLPLLSMDRASEVASRFLFETDHAQSDIA